MLMSPFQMSTEEIIQCAAKNRIQYDQTHAESVLAALVNFEYVYLLYSCGDNTLERAKVDGALDARELYPDFKPESLEEGVKQFYAEVPDYLITTMQQVHCGPSSYIIYSFC